MVHQPKAFSLKSSKSDLMPEDSEKFKRAEKRRTILNALVRYKSELLLIQQYQVIQSVALIRAEIKKLTAELIELDGGGKPPS